MAENKKPTQAVSEQLPVEARLMLVMAAQTPVTSDDPLARTKAIEWANEQIRHKWPALFRRD